MQKAIQISYTSKKYNYHSISKVEEENTKHKHNLLMKKVYNVIQKLKKLNDNEQLSKAEIDLLV